jgi:hypothetical protein
MSTKRQYTYAIGDRVAERPKTHGLFTNQPHVRERISQYRKQRYGTVVGMTTKLTARKQKLKVLVIQWDNLKSPTEHAQMRICPISELDILTKNTLVPGE